MYSEIKLTRGAVALVDTCDFDALNRHRWHLHKTGYATRNVKRNGRSVMVRMHRVINQTPEGMETDHINGNKLDNRRCNLRSCDPSQNCLNRKLRSDNKSGCAGVYFNKARGRWHVSIAFRGKRRFLGVFTNLDEAKQAYARAKHESDPI